MTSPEPEPFNARNETPPPEPLVVTYQVGGSEPVPPKPENEVVSWLKAIAYGIRDTAEDMVEEGRRVAHEAYNAGWQRYDAKTKHRRSPRD